MLGAAVGDLDLDMFLEGGERGAQPGLLAVAEVLLTGAEDVPDAVERVVAAPAVTGRLLLDAAADVINDRSGELHDMEGVDTATVSSGWSSMAFL